MGRILGARAAARRVGGAVGGVAEVFVGNRAERDAAAAKTLDTVVRQYQTEFTVRPAGRFDRFVDALNRLPRPIMVFGTVWLFVYAMTEPAGFSTRMRGLALVPDPLWWLLGAIVSFYFGARELHHQRNRAALTVTRAAPASPGTAEAPAPDPAPADAAPLPLAGAGAVDPDFNPAVEEWRRQRG